MVSKNLSRRCKNMFFFILYSSCVHTNIVYFRVIKGRFCAELQRNWTLMTYNHLLICWKTLRKQSGSFIYNKNRQTRFVNSSRDSGLRRFPLFVFSFFWERWNIHILSFPARHSCFQNRWAYIDNWHVFPWNAGNTRSLSISHTHIFTYSFC